MIATIRGRLPRTRRVSTHRSASMHVKPALYVVRLPVPLEVRAVTSCQVQYARKWVHFLSFFLRRFGMGVAGGVATLDSGKMYEIGSFACSDRDVRLT